MKVSTYGQMGVGIICCMVIGLVWFVIPSYLFIIKKCNFLCDPALSSTVQKSLNNYVEEYYINKPFNALSFDGIKRQFPMIAQVDSTYTNEGLLQCSFKSLRPRMFINDQHLLMEDDSVQSIVNFSNEILCTLPRLFMEQEDIHMLSRECTQCLKNLPNVLFERFSVRWVNYTALYLHDRQFPNISLRVDCQSILDDRLLNKYDKVKSEIVRQRYYAKKQWVVDARFKNQIVVAQRSVEGL